MSAFRLVTTFVLFCVVVFGDLTTFFGDLHLVTTTSKDFWFGIIIKITTTIMRVGPGLILLFGNKRECVDLWNQFPFRTQKFTIVLSKRLDTKPLR